MPRRLGTVLDGVRRPEFRPVQARAILDKASLDLAAHSGQWMVERHEMRAPRTVAAGNGRRPRRRGRGTACAPPRASGGSEAAGTDVTDETIATHRPRAITALSVEACKFGSGASKVRSQRALA